MNHPFATNPDSVSGILLVGCPRSGTTLLQSLLASHPAIRSFPESHYLLHVAGMPPARWFDSGQLAVPFRWRHLLAEFRITCGISSRLPAPGKDEFFRDLGMERPTRTPIRLSTALRRFTAWMDAKAAREGYRFWLEKTPDHVCYLDLVDRFLPDLRVIHLFRRGEDVVASLHDAAKKYPEVWRPYEDIRRCIAHWNRTIQWSMQFLGRPNHIVVDYHRLAAEPQQELHRLLHWLDPALVELQINSARQDVAAQVTANEPWKARTASAIRSESRFEHVFNEDTQRTIREHLVSTERLRIAAAQGATTA